MTSSPEVSAGEPEAPAESQVTLLARWVGSSYAPEEKDETTVLRIVNLMLRDRHLLFWVPLSFALAAVVFSLSQSRTYTSTASFIPREGAASDGSGLRGVASQLGIDVGSSGDVGTPMFYEELLRTREILEVTVTKDYAIPEDLGGGSGSLIEIFDIDAEKSGNGVPDAVKRLRERTRISRNGQTGIVEVEVSTQWPGVSKEITENLLQEVNNFNLERRQTQAAAERSFIEERLETLRTELLEAETELQQFLQRNREFENSPELTFQYDRLQRAVNLRQQVVISLSETLETARIEEARNIPLVTIIDRPSRPWRPDARGTILRTLTFLVVGFVLALTVSFFREVVSGLSRREGDEDVREFLRLRREIKEELMRLLSPVRSRE